jgi:hypothetical protein
VFVGAAATWGGGGAVVVVVGGGGGAVVVVVGAAVVEVVVAGAAVVEVVEVVGATTVIVVDDGGGSVVDVGGAVVDDADSPADSADASAGVCLGRLSSTTTGTATNVEPRARASRRRGSALHHGGSSPSPATCLGRGRLSGSEVVTRVGGGPGSAPGRPGRYEQGALVATRAQRWTPGRHWSRYTRSALAHVT